MCVPAIFGNVEGCAGRARSCVFELREGKLNENKRSAIEKAKFRHARML